jgi:hypothetical protein
MALPGTSATNPVWKLKIPAKVKKIFGGRYMVFSL